MFHFFSVGGVFVGGEGDCSNLDDDGDALSTDRETDVPRLVTLIITFQTLVFSSSLHVMNRALVLQRCQRHFSVVAFFPISYHSFSNFF